MSYMSGIGHVIDDFIDNDSTKRNVAVNGQAACLTWVPKKGNAPNLPLPIDWQPRPSVGRKSNSKIRRSGIVEMGRQVVTFSGIPARDLTI